MHFRLVYICGCYVFFYVFNHLNFGLLLFLLFVGFEFVISLIMLLPWLFITCQNYFIPHPFVYPISSSVSWFIQFHEASIGHKLPVKVTWLHFLSLRINYYYNSIHLVCSDLLELSTYHLSVLRNKKIVNSSAFCFWIVWWLILMDVKIVLKINYFS